jgi:hypothetical protein
MQGEGIDPRGGQADWVRPAGSRLERVEPRPRTTPHEGDQTTGHPGSERDGSWDILEDAQGHPASRLGARRVPSLSMQRGAPSGSTAESRSMSQPAQAGAQRDVSGSANAPGTLRRELPPGQAADVRQQRESAHGGTEPPSEPIFHPSAAEQLRRAEARLAAHLQHTSARQGTLQQEAGPGTGLTGGTVPIDPGAHARPSNV